MKEETERKISMKKKKKKEGENVRKGCDLLKAKGTIK